MRALVVPAVRSVFRSSESRLVSPSLALPRARAPRSPSFAGAAARGALLVVAAAAGLAGCSRTVDLKLHVTAPCDQPQALAGIGTFRLTARAGAGVSGAELANETFTTGRGPASPEIPLSDDVTVTLEGWAGDADVNAAILNEKVQAVARSLPLDVTESTPTLDLLMLMGKRDTFAFATGKDALCRTLTVDPNATVKGRHGHTATFIPSINKVFIAGGAAIDGRVEVLLSSTVLYDPTTGEVEPFKDLDIPRAYHSATLLPNDKLLLVGGFSTINGRVTALAAASLVDFEKPDDPYEAINFVQERAHHTATLVPERNLVIIAGGCGPCRDGTCSDDACAPHAAGETSTVLGDPVQIFDVNSSKVTSVPTAQLAPRAFHAASLLRSNNLVVSGGIDVNGAVCSVEIFTFQQGSSALTGPIEPVVKFPNGRCPSRHAQVTTGSGAAQNVIILGGQTDESQGKPFGPATNAVFVVDGTGQLKEPVSAALKAGHAGHQAALLQDGSVLVVGGLITGAAITAERLAIQPGTNEVEAQTLEFAVRQAREDAAITPLPNNQVLYTGGLAPTSDASAFTSSESIDLYFGE